MTNSEFNLPIDDRYFEDYIPGSVYEFGSILVEEKDILDFAQKFDPQIFHLDKDKARNGPFGGLIASGWHTTALAMRLLVDHFLSKVAGMGSPGSGPIRFLKPVRPGDELCQCHAFPAAAADRRGRGRRRHRRHRHLQHGAVAGLHLPGH